MTGSQFDDPRYGTWVDSWWGIYAPAQVVLLAVEAGWAPGLDDTQPLALATLAYGSYVPRSVADDALAAAGLLSFEELDWGLVADGMLEASDEATAWLQEQAPPGSWWGWQYGSFGLWPVDAE